MPGKVSADAGKKHIRYFISYLHCRAVIAFCKGETVMTKQKDNLQKFPDKPKNDRLYHSHFYAVVHAFYG